MTDSYQRSELKTITVIGAGIIGICCALALQKKGFKVTLMDPESPGSKTSYGNAGGIAVTEVLPLSMPATLWQAPKWLLDPKGPLTIRWRHLPQLMPWFWRFVQAGSQKNIEKIIPVLTALLKSVYGDYKPLLQEAGAAHLLHQGGALTLYHHRKTYDKDAGDWALKREQGIRFETVSPQEINTLEPALASIFEVGVRNLDWGHIDDPQQLCTALFSLFLKRGGDYQQKAVGKFALESGQVRGVITQDGEIHHSDKVVLAAGVWSKALLQQLNSNVSLESERGYHVTVKQAQASLNNMIISAEGKFVMTPMSMGLRVAGTAEFAGLNAPHQNQRAQILLAQAKRFLPGIKADNTSTWSGHRPATPDSLPVIGAVPNHGNVFCAFGHGHLGLTLGPTTGRLLADLISGEPSEPSLAALRVDRF